MKTMFTVFYEKSIGYFYTNTTKQRIVLLFIGMLLVSSTTGCQLADANMSSSNDTLIGIYVTKEFIDPFAGDGNIYSSGFPTKKQLTGNRVYGNLDKEKETISFPGIKGFALLCVSQEENGNTYFKTIHENFSDIKTSVADDSCEISGILYYDSSKVAKHFFAESTEEYSDEFEDFDASRITTEKQEDGTTLYDYATEGEELSLYIHPIYETAGGEIYLSAQPGETFLSHGEISTSFSSSESATLNGSTAASNYRKFTVSVKAAASFDKLAFTQFDSKGNVLREDTYTTADVPKTYTQKKGCAYILVTSTDLTGTITYDTINQADETFSLFLPTDDIFCREVLIAIKKQ